MKLCFFELMITCTGLWLACFVIPFLYIWLFLFPRLLLSGLLLLLSKLYAILCLKETLGFDWGFVFWRHKNLDFLHFAVCVPCFNPLRLWWNCAFWIDYNMHWALIGLFCDTLFVYMTILISAVAFEWLATIAFEVICNFVPQGNAWLWLSVCFLET